ncbi:MAG: hypothetical protein ACK4NY_22905 [Spirosomataceae bacterium]
MKKKIFLVIIFEIFASKPIKFYYSPLEIAGLLSFGFKALLLRGEGLG